MYVWVYEPTCCAVQVRNGSGTALDGNRRRRKKLGKKTQRRRKKHWNSITEREHNSLVFFALSLCVPFLLSSSLLFFALRFVFFHNSLFIFLLMEMNARVFSSSLCPTNFAFVISKCVVLFFFVFFGARIYFIWKTIRNQLQHPIRVITTKERGKSEVFLRSVSTSVCVRVHHHIDEKDEKITFEVESKTKSSNSNSEVKDTHTPTPLRNYYYFQLNEMLLSSSSSCFCCCVHLFDFVGRTLMNGSGRA